VSEHLSDCEWDDLADLITEAPPERIQLALRRVDASAGAAVVLPSGVDRLLHLATISSGNAFDRALLRELRRLSVH
jgi:hypothetical protein